MRRLLALVSSIIFVDAMLYTALTPLVPGYADEFELSKTGAGLLVGAFGAGAIFGGIPGGLAAARFGPRSAVIGGLVLLGIASLAFAVAGVASSRSASRASCRASRAPSPGQGRSPGSPVSHPSRSEER